MNRTFDWLAYRSRASCSVAHAKHNFDVIWMLCISSRLNVSNASNLYRRCELKFASFAINCELKIASIAILLGPVSRCQLYVKLRTNTKTWRYFISDISLQKKLMRTLFWTCSVFITETIIKRYESTRMYWKNTGSLVVCVGGLGSRITRDKNARKYITKSRPFFPGGRQITTTRHR